MSNSANVNLLRLLEPAVRPGGLSGPSKAPTEPIEQRSFESLLEEARSLNVTGNVAGAAEPDLLEGSQEKPPESPEPPESPAKKPAGLIGQLAQFDRIDNPSLRRLIAGESGE
jgi:hypothetical protein